MVADPPFRASSFVWATALATSRPRSDDRAEVTAHGDALVVVVADGAGGMGGSSAASEALVGAVRSRLGKERVDPYDLRGWLALVAVTDAALARGIGGETTAVLVVVGEHGVVGISAGDSEAWLVTPNAIDRLTDGQARARIGSGRSAPTPFRRPALDGILVVGTDGLFNYANPASIVAACAAPVTDAANTLAALPRLRSGAYPDDVAVVVVARALDR